MTNNITKYIFKKNLFPNLMPFISVAFFVLFYLSCFFFFCVPFFLFFSFELDSFRCYSKLGVFQDLLCDMGLSLAQIHTTFSLSFFLSFQQENFSTQSTNWNVSKLHKHSSVANTEKNTFRFVFAVFAHCTLQIILDHINILDRKPGIYELTQFVLDLFLFFFIAFRFVHLLTTQNTNTSISVKNKN